MQKAKALPKLESKAKMISYKKTQQQIRSITTSGSTSPRRSVNHLAETIENEYGLRKSNLDDLRISQISRVTESYDKKQSEFEVSRAFSQGGTKVTAVLGSGFPGSNRSSKVFSVQKLPSRMAVDVSVNVYGALPA